MNSQDTLTDARQPGWFWMEDAVIDHYGKALGAIGIAIYAYLARRADKNGVSFPSFSTIAAELALGRRTVIKYIHKLEALGLIVVLRHKGNARASNEYRLVNLREGAPTPLPPPTPPSPRTIDGQLPPRTEAPHSLACTGAAGALVQELHQSEPPSTDAGAALVPQMHRGGAADAPAPVQEIHPTGAPDAPEGNTCKETQKKEIQLKEVKRESQPMVQASPSGPSPHLTPANSSLSDFSSQPETPPADADMLAALAEVTGKNLSLLRAEKRAAYADTAARLAAAGFSSQDVRDFAAYWHEAHPLGSNKPNAGRPHLVQVREDLTGAMDWIRQRRRRQAEEATWAAELEARMQAQTQADGIDDAAASVLWHSIRDALILRLGGHPLANDLPHVQALSWEDDILTLRMPSDNSAAWWRARGQRVLADVVALAVDHPLEIRLLGPSEVQSPTNVPPSSIPTGAQSCPLSIPAAKPSSSPASVDAMAYA